MADNKQTRNKQPGSRLAPVTHIGQLIYVMRGKRVILDQDLARLYGTTTKRLNEQVRRNIDRFPEDFAFLLSPREVKSLKSQSATSGWGGRRKPPRVFTEHGAVMAASVLNTPIAVQASIYVVRAFVQMHQLLLTHGDMERKLRELEHKVGRHDRDIRIVFESIRKLYQPKPDRNQRRIGFQKD